MALRCSVVQLVEPRIRFRIAIGKKNVRSVLRTRTVKRSV